MHNVITMLKNSGRNGSCRKYSVATKSWGPRETHPGIRIPINERKCSREIADLCTQLQMATSHETLAIGLLDTPPETKSLNSRSRVRR